MKADMATAVPGIMSKSYHPEVDRIFVLIYQASGSVIGPVLHQLQWLGDGNVLHALVQITCCIPGARDKIGFLRTMWGLGRGEGRHLCIKQKVS